MMKLITFILSLCVFSLCQAQDWTPIDIGTQEDLNKVYFMDDANGIIIGDNGTLFKTTDGGSNWVNIPTGASHDLVTVSFVDQNVGFINGLKTTNGGDNWTVQSTTEIFSLIKGLDAENLIGGHGFIFDGAVYKSTDGGLTWQAISYPIETGFYTDEYFVDDNIGYMTSWYSGHLIKTEDGGENWTELTSISQTTDFSDYRGVTFPSLNIGIVASNAHIVKTMDGGASWSSIYSILDNNLLFSTKGVFSTSENNYIVVGGSLDNSVETIYETTDGA